MIKQGWWYTEVRDSVYQITKENALKLLDQLQNNFDEFRKDHPITKETKEEWIKKLNNYPNLRV